MNDLRIVFMGSPDFAAPSLYKLSSHFNLVGVITQPDRPAGRGKMLQHSAIKKVTLELDLPLFQPNKINTPATLSILNEWQPAVIVVVAYGQILKPAILSIPAWGCINVHASLLPRWRGAAPIQASILHGDKVTGITIMLMDKGMDTGPILSQQEVMVDPEATGGSLFKELSELGSDLLIDTIMQYVRGNITPIPQEHQAATFASMISKSDGRLNPELKADQLSRQIRAYQPWPSSFFMWQGRRFVIRKAHTGANISTIVGYIGVVDNKPAIQTSSGSLIIDIIQPAGKKVRNGDAFLNGYQQMPDTCIDSLG